MWFTRIYADYKDEAGLAYHHVPQRAGSEEVSSWKLCIPANMMQVLKENRDAPTSRHLGGRKIIAKVSAGYFWPGIWRNISIGKCKICMWYKPNQMKAAGKMSFKSPSRLEVRNHFNAPSTLQDNSLKGRKGRSKLWSPSLQEKIRGYGTRTGQSLFWM